MYITAMTHRDELYELTLRWLNDDLDVDDGRAVTEVFLYESIVAAFVVEQMIGFVGRVVGRPVQAERVHQKHLLRERIIQYLTGYSPRVQELASGFRANPEYFFPGVPVDAVLITTSGSYLAAIGRIKRLSRVAEKFSYRLRDALSAEIDAEARRLAEQRADAADMPSAVLARSEEAMHRDQVDAETAVAQRFRNGSVQIDRAALAVNDVVGFKIIGGPDARRRVFALLETEPRFTLVETEKHSGEYNALNLLVDVRLPAPDELAGLYYTLDWTIALRYGLEASQARGGFHPYLADGCRSVRVEIILTTPEELMESEFGGSIHEQRILRLRQRPVYAGPIAQNARYLMEHLIALALSPVTLVTELPFKMYGRYLPETVTAARCALFGNEVDGGSLNAFCLQADCLGQFCAVPCGPHEHAPAVMGSPGSGVAPRYMHAGSRREGVPHVQ